MKKALLKLYLINYVMLLGPLEDLTLCYLRTEFYEKSSLKTKKCS
jgi:hypothetical protein